MSGLCVRRLCAVLVVLVLAVGLSVRAAQGPAMAAPMGVAAGPGDVQMPEGCDGDGGRDDASAPARCPMTAFCFGLVAIVGEGTAPAPALPGAFPVRGQPRRGGLSPGPDPYPPRLSRHV